MGPLKAAPTLRNGVNYPLHEVAGHLRAFLGDLKPWATFSEFGIAYLMGLARVLHERLPPAPDTGDDVPPELRQEVSSASISTHSRGAGEPLELELDDGR